MFPNDRTNVSLGGLIQGHRTGVLSSDTRDGKGTTISHTPMINPRYYFKLDGECQVETEGWTVQADSLTGLDYSEGDYFGDEHQPTYDIRIHDAGYTVKQEDVVEIIDLREVPADDDGRSLYH